MLHTQIYRLTLLKTIPCFAALQLCRVIDITIMTAFVQHHTQSYRGFGEGVNSV